MSHALYLIISFFLLYFLINIPLYLTSLTISSVWTTGPNTSHFSNVFNFVRIYSFHFDQYFLCCHSSIVSNLGSSSFLIIPIVTWKENILLMTKSISIPFFSIYK